MAKKKSKHKHSRSTHKPKVRSKTAASVAQAPPEAAVAPDSPAVLVAPAAGVQSSPGTLDSSNRWYYVRGDLRRIAGLAALCIGLELVLWYVLSYSPLGDSIYQLITI